MQRYFPSEGFGVDGLTVGNTGTNVRFRRPVGEVTLVNTSAAAVYFVINKLVSDAGVESDTPSGFSDDRVGEATVAQALAEALYLPANGTLTIKGPIDSIHGRRGIASLWLYCATSAVIKGGSTGL
jgi:hypothetical protein